MDAPWYQLLSAASTLVAGVVITWLVTRSHQRKSLIQSAVSALQVPALLQWELSTLRGRASRIPQLESALAASVEALNAANERKALLEAEVQRLLELERARASAVLELVTSSRTTPALRERVNRLGAALTADRAALAAIAIRFK
jgi:hypothetical protein